MKEGGLEIQQFDLVHVLHQLNRPFWASQKGCDMGVLAMRHGGFGSHRPGHAALIVHTLRTNRVIYSLRN